MERRQKLAIDVCALHGRKCEHSTIAPLAANPRSIFWLPPSPPSNRALLHCQVPNGCSHATPGCQVRQPKLFREWRIRHGKKSNVALVTCDIYVKNASVLGAGHDSSRVVWNNQNAH